MSFICKRLNNFHARIYALFTSCGFRVGMVNEGAGGPRSRRASHKTVPSSEKDDTGTERTTGEPSCPNNGNPESLNSFELFIFLWEWNMTGNKICQVI